MTVRLHAEIFCPQAQLEQGYVHKLIRKRLAPTHFFLVKQREGQVRSGHICREFSADKFGVYWPLRPTFFFFSRCILVFRPIVRQCSSNSSKGNSGLQLRHSKHPTKRASREPLCPNKLLTFNWH